MKLVKIGTRDSKLAVVQAEMVAAAIRRHRPDIEVQLVPMKSTGDMQLDKELHQIGGKGVFVKELDEALVRGDVDICAHSYKDVPGELCPSTELVAVSPREDPRDVLILPKGVQEIDPQKPIGCSSLRRCVQLREIFPGQPTAPIRGNILTRLKKLDRGEFSGIVLAAAGLIRLDLWARASRPLSVTEMIPAACQGVIAVQGRTGENYDYLQAFHDVDTWDETIAERAFVRTLNCGCGAPIGVFAQVSGTSVFVAAMMEAEDGTIVRDTISGLRTEADALGVLLATRLRERQGQHV